ncbi:MAG: hypothetical protein KDE58_37550, partial [Caldilineaceae bacterium]|nr:hypothetical protein [Caldilineaceae bacterium]
MLDAVIHPSVLLVYLVPLSLGAIACWVQWQPGQPPQRVYRLAMTVMGVALLAVLLAATALL